MREKIAKALKARSKAIKNALDNYNTCAAKLNPPRPPLTWTKVTESVYLAELDVLQDARQDIRTLKWAQPAHREAMNLHFSLKRAQEEVQRLNVELRRTLTFMRDDHADYFRAIQRLMVSNSSLARALSSQWEYRSSIHEVIYGWLQKTSKLDGFSGVLLPGCHAGRPIDDFKDIFSWPLWWHTMYNHNDLLDDDGWDDIDSNVDGIIEFMENLSDV